MYVVTGATGQTGSVVAQTLLERGQRVRVVVRDGGKGARWRAAGAEVVVANLEDRAAMTEVLQGATGVYLLVPPDYRAPRYLEDRKRLTEAMAAAVKDSAANHVVLLSSIGAHLPSGTGPIRVLAHAEGCLGEATRNLTLLRASYFMENWKPLLATVQAKGLLPSFLSPARRIPMVATLDIGRLAAECLLDQAKGCRVLELSGPEEYSPQDVAEAIARRVGRPVAVEHLSLDAVVPTFTAMGASEDAARLFEEMYAAMENGRLEFEGQGTCRPRGLVTLAEALSGWV